MLTHEVSCLYHKVNLLNICAKILSLSILMYYHEAKTRLQNVGNTIRPHIQPIMKNNDFTVVYHTYGINNYLL